MYRNKWTLRSNPCGTRSAPYRLGACAKLFFLQTFQLSDSFARALKNRFESFSLFLTELKVISHRILNGHSFNNDLYL